MKNKKTGKTSLSICRGYRDENGKVKHSTIETLGLLENLQKEYDDPIAHFLTCFIALVLGRVLQHKLDKKYSVGKIFVTIQTTLL